VRGGAADGEGGSGDADAEGQVPLSAPDAAAPVRREEPAAAPATDAGRKRAAVDLAARHGHLLRQTAQRYSLCAEDAEDAYQRTLEILLVKAPTDRPRELLGWSRTVVKHEALAIRHHRERMLGTPPRGGDGEAGDRIAQIPARGGGPEERLEQSERVARSREALRLLKPAELRALTLLAEGYTYAEIGEITGFSQTKVNRCLAEGREHFRRQFTRSEDGSRCTEMSPLLSAFCDGQTSPEQSAEVREHLRACAGCRAALRAYRAAPGAIAALAPALPAWRALLERGQEMVAGLQARLPGGGAADATLAQVAAAGGARGGGMAALAKLLAVCAGTAGSAACVAAGVAPVPFDLTPERAETPRIERVAERAYEPPAAPAPVEPEPAVEPTPPEPEPVEAASPAPEAAPSAEAGAVEYAPPPPPPPAPATSGDPAGSGSGSAAGEFGP